MNEFLLSFCFTGMALSIMIICFRLAAIGSHSLARRLKKIIEVPDFDFTAPHRTKEAHPTLEQKAEHCWALFNDGLSVECELQVTELLKHKLSSRTRVRCLHLQALLMINQENFDTAENILWQALAIRDGYENPIDELDLRLGLARLFHLSNSLELELRQLERVVLIADQYPDDFLPGFESKVLAPVLLNLGEAYLAERQPSKAAACFTRVLEICSEGGSELLIANARTRLESINR